MFILPHQFFSVENYFGIIPKFIPHPFALNWVRGLLGTNKVKIHGYIIRIVKQIGSIKRKILIPRIIAKTDNSCTHVLLPEFILPYCNYTCKSLATVFTETIPSDTLNKLSISEWDKNAKICLDFKNQKVLHYLKSRDGPLHYRFETVPQMFIGLRMASKCKLYCTWKPCFTYYLFDEKLRCISILEYQRHMISFYGTG